MSKYMVIKIQTITTLHWHDSLFFQNLEDLKVQAQKKQEATVALPSDLKRKRSSPTPPEGSGFKILDFKI